MGIKRRQVLLFTGTFLLLGFLQQPIHGQQSRSLVQSLKEITLQVMTPGSPGSGVIIQRKGSTYYFLTAKHVLESAAAGEQIFVITRDGQEHPVRVSRELGQSSVDVAIASFQSENQYAVPRLGDSQTLEELDTIYVAGFPLATASVPNPTIAITTGQISSIGNQPDGYGLGYTANTQVGMSGGPVINQDGSLVGIHGRADGERIGEVRVKTGLNWAVPISTAISLFSLREIEAIGSSRDSSSPESDSTNSDSRPEYIKTASGLKYRDIVVGSGNHPRPGQEVSVHYTGTLPNGKSIDSSRERGKPFTYPFKSGRVIPGLDEGIGSMKIGGRREIVIPPNLGYGSRAVGDKIPANSVLIFDIELLDIR